jgi:predicted SprT family Zn-dependent metalloprotease
MSAAASVVELHPEPSDSGSYDPKRAATPSTEQYAAFEVIFNHFNAELFEGRLSPVMLAFSKKQKSLGYYKHERWRRPGEERGRVGEIALTPEHLADDERDVASTVVHEMVHLWQFTYGKASRRGYHNAEWAAKMEALGLVPSNTGEPGGKRTGQGMTHYIVEGGPFTMAYEKLGRDVLLPFIAGSAVLKDKPEPKPADPSKTKFTCPVCGDSARGKVTLQIDCHKCAVPMVPETPPPIPQRRPRGRRSALARAPREPPKKCRPQTPRLTKTRISTGISSLGKTPLPSMVARARPGEAAQPRSKSHRIQRIDVGLTG